MSTLKDVAKEAGLTVGTVSRVLNNRGYISDDARRKVEEAMKKLNYHPNEAARSLHGKSTNTIGVIVPHISHPYFAEMISHLEAQAYRKGYKILLGNSQNRDEKIKQYLDLCVSNRVVGIILGSGTVSVDVFGEIDVPVVTVERYLDSGTAAVECDNKWGGVLAAEKLISCGCKHLLYIGGIRNVSMPAELRAEGFREVCEKKKIPFVEVFTDKEQFSSQRYYESIEEALQTYRETDGMFVDSDVIAAQTLQVCRKLNISVPEQMKLIGFDDVSITSLTTPRLTTIHQPVGEMVETAVNLLLDSIEGKPVAKKTVLPVYLVEREST